MKWTLTLLALLLALCPARGQDTGELADILNQAMRHPCLQQFIPVDSGGTPYLLGLLANNQIPEIESLHYLGHPLPVTRGRRREASAGHLLLRRLRLRPGRAKVRLHYGPDVQARIRLAWRPGLGWQLDRGWVLRRKRGPKGKRSLQ
ncbi:MAG: hypothetical protein D6722_11890, partial [Bacteroidetes bacterium]